MIITPGELEVGMQVTIHSWLEPLYNQFGSPLPKKTGLGVIFTVRAWCNPYVAVECADGSRIGLDTRECRLTLLTDGYVAAIRGSRGGETTERQYRSAWEERWDGPPGSQAPNCRCTIVPLPKEDGTEESPDE